MESHRDAMEALEATVDSRMDSIEGKVDDIEGNMANMNSRMTALEGKMNEMLEILRKSSNN